MDAFSEILKAVKLQGALFFNGEFSAPWSIRASGKVAKHFSAAEDRLIIYHLLTEGRASVLFEDGQRTDLCSGDLVMFPGGDPHILCHGDAGQSIESSVFLDHILTHGMKLLRLGAGGEITRFVCGFMACDARMSQVFLNGLPRFIKVRITESASGAWLHDSIRFSVQHSEAHSPGCDAVLAKLSEVLFIETLRTYIAELPAEQTGWLAAARDAEISKVLTLMHQAPARPWKLSALAQAAGVSRSVLAERFHHLLGEPPMTYLMRWRLQLGADMMKSTSYSVAQVAAEVGYESEASFNRAFKREFGQPPARFRSTSRTT